MLTAERQMSDSWLKAQRQSERVEFHGPSIRWPIGSHDCRSCGVSCDCGAECQTCRSCAEFDAWHAREAAI